MTHHHDSWSLIIDDMEESIGYWRDGEIVWWFGLVDCLIGKLLITNTYCFPDEWFSDQDMFLCLSFTKSQSQKVWWWSQYDQYSQMMRPNIRNMYPESKNTELSSLLPKNWEANEEENFPMMKENYVNLVNIMKIWPVIKIKWRRNKKIRSLLILPSHLPRLQENVTIIRKMRIWTKSRCR